MIKKKHETVKAMYFLYEQGYSLQEVGVAFMRSRQAVFEILKGYGYALRAKKPLPFIEFEGKKYTKRNTGYYGMTDGKRTLLHRDVWEAKNGKIAKGWDVHHKDFNSENNRIDNLECLSKAEHTRKYSPHHNQYTKRS